MHHLCTDVCVCLRVCMCVCVLQVAVVLVSLLDIVIKRVVSKVRRSAPYLPVSYDYLPPAGSPHLMLTITF